MALAVLASATAGAHPAVAAPTSAPTSAPAQPPMSAPTTSVPQPQPQPSMPGDPSALIEANPKLDSQLLVAAGVPGSDSAATGDVPRYDNDRVSVVVSGSAAAQAVADAGGQLIAAADGAIAAYVPASKLADLADSDLVTAVRAPTQAQVSGVVTEGLAASGAALWQGAGRSGKGVQVAIIDIGFGSLAREVANGNLPAGLSVRSNQCGSALNSSPHGTAVAEIVSQTAPSAQLVLYCIQDSSQFTAAAQDIAAEGIKLVISSLGFPGDARGDGVLEDPMSAAAAVRHANQDAGIFWVQSAGNNGDSHFRGVLDGSAAQLVDTVSAMSFANTVAVEWDQWSGAVANVLVCVQLVKVVAGSTTSQGSQACSPNNYAPSRSVPRVTRSLNAATGSNLFYEVSVLAPAELNGLRFDVTYTYGTWNGVSSPQITSSDPMVTGGSITSPASSPYAFAVGAVDVGTGLREPFSGQGPTIDGRTKPDLVGYDNVVSNLYSPTFLGTSAAAPSVAGAAALVLEANPGWTADQLGAYLRASANAGAPIEPPSNELGAGKLTLGAVSRTAVAAFITALYLDVLGRTPSGEEIGFWDRAVAAGLSQGAMVEAFVYSTESLNGLVSQLYATELGRAPDPGGLATWAAQLRSASYTSVRSSIAGSAEAVARANGTPPWIAALYTAELDRAAGPSEVAFWSTVAATYGPFTVSTGIVGSAEARNRRAAELYARFLARPADVNGIAFWSGQIGTRGDLAVWTGFLESPEYFGRAATR